MASEQVDFGFSNIARSDKVKRVGAVFSSVASRYDLMNDAMSAGAHRLWKHSAVDLLGLKAGQRVLDLAGGSGDLSCLIAAKHADIEVSLCDINPDMLQRARSRLLDNGLFNQVELVEADAEQLPYADSSFDAVIIGFGLRNVTEREQVLREMRRVLRAGGKLVVLEFSPLENDNSIFSQFYDLYSFNVIPRLGRLLTGDQTSYQYLVESIRVFPSKQQLLKMLQQVGFVRCDYRTLSAGAVALHWGYA